jgi:hypothetical protein
MPPPSFMTGKYVYLFRSRTIIGVWIVPACLSSDGASLATYYYYIQTVAMPYACLSYQCMLLLRMHPRYVEEEEGRTDRQVKGKGRVG